MAAVVVSNQGDRTEHGGAVPAPCTQAAQVAAMWCGRVQWGNGEPGNVGKCAQRVFLPWNLSHPSVFFPWNAFMFSQFFSRNTSRGKKLNSVSAAHRVFSHGIYLLGRFFFMESISYAHFFAWNLPPRHTFFAWNLPPGSEFFSSPTTGQIWA